MYPCTKCGCCCRNLHKSELYFELDRGDGVCKYLNENKCSIYDTRPLICRIDACYDMFFSMHMSRDEFYKLNLIICNKLQISEE